MAEIKLTHFSPFYTVPSFSHVLCVLGCKSSAQFAQQLHFALILTCQILTSIQLKAQASCQAPVQKTRDSGVHYRVFGSHAERNGCLQSANSVNTNPHTSINAQLDFHCMASKAHFIAISLACIAVHIRRIHIQTNAAVF